MTTQTETKKKMVRIEASYITVKVYEIEVDESVEINDDTIEELIEAAEYDNVEAFEITYQKPSNTEVFEVAITGVDEDGDITDWAATQNLLYQNKKW